jgi:diadenylate cyclase
LPVSERDDLPAQYGLRHRAAIGMSEATDTLVLVVSEETGQLSVVRNGVMFYNLSPAEIRRKVNDYMYEETTPEEATVDTIIKEDIKRGEKEKKDKERATS